MIHTDFWDGVKMRLHKNFFLCTVPKNKLQLWTQFWALGGFYSLTLIRCQSRVRKMNIGAGQWILKRAGRTFSSSTASDRRHSSLMNDWAGFENGAASILWCLERVGGCIFYRVTMFAAFLGTSAHLEWNPDNYRAPHPLCKHKHYYTPQFMRLI